MSQQELYERVMSCVQDFSQGLWTLRLWDGMDGCWTDLDEATAVSGQKALEVWAQCTENGAKKVRFDDIDYYKIFPADTRMHWDGSEGREMMRRDPCEGDDPPPCPLCLLDRVKTLTRSCICAGCAARLHESGIPLPAPEARLSEEELEGLMLNRPPRLQCIHSRAKLYLCLGKGWEPEAKNATKMPPVIARWILKTLHAAAKAGKEPLYDPRFESTITEYKPEPVPGWPEDDPS